MTTSTARRCNRAAMAGTAAPIASTGTGSSPRAGTVRAGGDEDSGDDEIAALRSQ